MATHSSTLAWKIPWTEEPGRLQSMGSPRVKHDWATSLSLFTFMHWRRKWQPTPCSCLESPRDRGTWWVAVYGVTQSWTRLKQLSSSSSSISLVVFKIFLKKYFSVIFLVWLSWYLSFDFANLHKPLNGHLPGDLKFFAIVSANILPHSLSHLLWFSLQVY